MKARQGATRWVSVWANRRRAAMGASLSATGKPALMILSLVAALSATACGGGTASQRATPNIVLVTVDTLRSDHLEAYGYGRPTAPFMAEMAQSGVLFASAVSQAPWTLPAMASLHTGVYPSQHGAFAAETALPEAAETLAERLKGAGYNTVAVVSHEFVSAKHGFAQGFDIFNEDNVLGHEAVTSRDLTMAALAAVGEVQEPYFLWVHYFDPHFSYVRHPDVGFADGYTGGLPDLITSGRLTAEERQPMAAYDLDYVKAVYDEEIAYTDEWIGKLWEGLQDRGGVDDTLLIVTADHGEYFLERGRFFHGKDVYRELVGVPLIIAGDIGDELRGRVVESAVETRSVPLTLTEMLGLEPGDFGGVDLFGVAAGQPSDGAIAEGTYAFGDDSRTVGIQHEGWKLVFRLSDNGYELYDLAADPWERDNVFDQHGAASDIVYPLLERLDALRDLPRLEQQAIGLSPEAIERLRALGYIGR